MKSVEELKVINSQNLATLLSGLANIGSRAAVLENQDAFLTPTIVAQITNIITDVEMLMARNWISGGNLTVSDTVPASPQENDIWFDTKLARS